MEEGAWHTHSDIIMLAIIASKDEEFAVSTILKIRGSESYGDFHVTMIYFSADTLDWTG